ncbi:MAG: hypothetical protein WA210_07510, partial [Burkholderiaceae bacterium]
MNDTRTDLAHDKPNGAHVDKATRKPGTGKTAPARGFNWKKWSIVAAVGAAGIASVVAMLQPQVIEVQLAAARHGPLAVAVEAQGRTRAKLRYTVAAPISGRLLRTSFGVGERVERGDVLARIAPPPT